MKRWTLVTVVKKVVQGVDEQWDDTIRLILVNQVRIEAIFWLSYNIIVWFIVFVKNDVQCIVILVALEDWFWLL